MNSDLIGGDSLQPLPCLQSVIAALEAWGSDDLIEPTKRRKRRPSLATRIKQVQRTGLRVAAVRPDGTIVIAEPGEAGEVADDTTMIIPRKSDWH